MDEALHIRGASLHSAAFIGSLPHVARHLFYRPLRLHFLHFPHHYDGMELLQGRLHISWPNLGVICALRPINACRKRTPYSNFVRRQEHQEKGERYIYPEYSTNIIPEDRYCDVCDLPKPPRVAHCKYCGRCIPKMDHHCSWTANCVGEKNHKYFVLFLFYMTCLATYILSIILLRVAAIVINIEDVRLDFTAPPPLTSL